MFSVPSKSFVFCATYIACFIFLTGITCAAEISVGDLEDNTSDNSLGGTFGKLLGNIFAKTPNSASNTTSQAQVGRGDNLVDEDNFKEAVSAYDAASKIDIFDARRTQAAWDSEAVAPAFTKSVEPNPLDARFDYL
jgi:hypothetical protein